MPTYAYEALNSAGKPQKGTIDATTTEEALHAGAWRSTVSWQLTPGWSLRAIVERHTTDAHPQWSSARRQRPGR